MFSMMFVISTINKFKKLEQPEKKMKTKNVSNSENIDYLLVI